MTSKPHRPTPLPKDGKPHAVREVPRQFASTARLFSGEQFARLAAAHIGVIGVGGVGSWAAETLARCGVGRLTVVDADHVAESNINRQVQALHSTLGMAKIDALRARIADIAPDCQVRTIDDFLSPDNAADIMSEAGVIWIDATDDVRAKTAMVLAMHRQKRLKHLIVSGAAGGKTDPTRIEVADLSQTTQDPLLSSLRYDLRRRHGFPRAGSMKIQAVVCRQPVTAAPDCDPSAKLACAGYGSLVTVTACMGMVAANRAMLLAMA